MAIGRHVDMRILHTVSYTCPGCKIKDCLKRVSGKQFIQNLKILYITMIKGEILILSQIIQPMLLEPDIVIVVQIVQPDNCKTLIQQNLGCFRTYETGSTRQQYGFHINSCLCVAQSNIR